MRMGQTLDKGRYEVVRKLGYGTNSSVWLAKEAKYASHYPRRPETDFSSYFPGLTGIVMLRSRCCQRTPHSSSAKTSVTKL